MEKIIANDFITEVEGYSLKEIGDYLFGTHLIPFEGRGFHFENDLKDQDGNTVFDITDHIGYDTTNAKFGYYCLKCDADGYENSKIKTLTNGEWKGFAHSCTVAFWAKIEEPVANRLNTVYISARDSEYESEYISLMLGTGSGVMTRIGGTDINTYLTKSIVDDEWAFYAISYDKDTEKLYWVVNDEYETVDLSSYDPADGYIDENDLNQLYFGIELKEGYNTFVIEYIDDLLWLPDGFIGPDDLVSHYKANRPWE